MKRATLLLAASLILSAQSHAPQPVTLEAAVTAAVARYPQVRVSEEQLAAAAAGIQLARTSYLPRVDALAQVNRATRNNIFGLVLPQPVIPSISGPVLGTNNLTNVWGSAVGVLASWEPFDFGLRSANVNISQAGRHRAEETGRRTRFDVAGLAADAYLTLLAAEAAEIAAKAGVTRAESIQQAIAAVVNAELRPGADLSRANAESVLARTQVIQAHQAVEMARATLVQLTGMAVATVPLGNGATQAPSGVANHPRVLEQTAVVDEVKARQLALDRSWYPKFNLQASTYARGSGAQVDGSTGGAVSGLGPNIQNWAVGFSVMFPLFDLASIKAKKQIETHNERAEMARRDQIEFDLRIQVTRAQAALSAARQIAENTPVLLRAARTAEEQATARYKAGLSSVIEVAEAVRLVTQAEIDDALARLNIRRAELALAAAAGDLDPFLAGTRQ